PLVDPAEAKVPIPEAEADRRSGEDRVEQRVRLALPLAGARRLELRAFSVRDVLTDAGPAPHRIVVVDERDRADAHVARIAGGVDHPPLALVARAARHRFAPCGCGCAAIVRVHGAGPSGPLPP